MHFKNFSFAAKCSRWLVCVCCNVMAKDAQCQKRFPIIQSIEARASLNLPYGDRCFDVSDYLGVPPRDIDYSLIGLCAKPALSGSVGWYVAKRLGAHIGLGSGFDIALRRERYERSASPLVTNTVVQWNINRFRLEVPLYMLWLNDSWSIGFGGKVLIAQAYVDVREREDGERFRSDSDGLEIAGFDFQYSFRGTLRVLELERNRSIHIVSTCDHRDKWNSQARRGWIDVSIGAAMVW